MHHNIIFLSDSCLGCDFRPIDPLPVFFLPDDWLNRTRSSQRKTAKRSHQFLSVKQFASQLIVSNQSFDSQVDCAAIFAVVRHSVPFQ